MENRNGGLILSPGCSNDCFFCGLEKKQKKVKIYLKNKTELTDDYFSEEKKNVLKNILEFKKRGINCVEISGCDPIEYDDIVSLIKYLKFLCFERVILSTHGKRLADKEFAQQLNQTGLDEIRIPLYGPNSTIHDKVTLTKGSFDMTFSGINNLLQIKTKINIVVNCIICKPNKDSVIKLIDLLRKLNINTLELLIPYVSNNDFEYYIPLKELQPVVKKIYNYAKSIDYPLKFRKIPFCVLGKYDKSFQNIDTPPDLGSNCQPPPVYQSGNKDTPWYRLKQKANICESCACSDICSGFNLTDLKTFGIGNLKPIKSRE
jgi:MoaA/NifB/PqqE/SkfB family radical SAM enzyme